MSDWYPKSRADQIVIVRNWINIMDADTRAAWSIPAPQFADLGALFGAAQTLLQKAQSSDRTPVITEQCREAFEALETKARFFKGHFFLLPPLVTSDLINLRLRPRDPPTPTGTPTAEAAVETFLLGRHELGLKIVFVSGDPDDKANEGFRIWYKVVPPGGGPVTDPTQLSESFLTRRKKDVLQFEYQDSGRTAWMGVQIENGGKKGPWGPLTESIIP
jgi:hypothetical protein